MTISAEIFVLSIDLPILKMGYLLDCPFTMNVVWRPKSSNCSEIACLWSTEQGQVEENRFYDPEWIQQNLLVPEMFEFEKKLRSTCNLCVFLLAWKRSLLVRPCICCVSMVLKRRKWFDLTRGRSRKYTKCIGINTDVSLYEQLLTFVQEHVEDIDKGVYLLPKHLLAKEVISYSTMGINRIANRPFSVIQSQSGDLLTDIKQQWSLLQKRQRFAVGEFADSLIDRLNNGSCQGCHQASSTADLFLGEEDEEINGITNRSQIPFSSHFWKIKRDVKNIWHNSHLNKT